jgi:hypothetical protein
MKTHPNEIDLLPNDLFKNEDIAQEAKDLGPKYVEAYHTQRDRQIRAAKE